MRRQEVYEKVKVRTISQSIRVCAALPLALVFLSITFSAESSPSEEFIYRGRVIARKKSLSLIYTPVQQQFVKLLLSTIRFNIMYETPRRSLVLNTALKQKYRRWCFALPSKKRNPVFSFPALILFSGWPMSYIVWYHVTNLG